VLWFVLNQLISNSYSKKKKRIPRRRMIHFFNLTKAKLRWQQQQQLLNESNN
jgi:hypothetical protein